MRTYVRFIDTGPPRGPEDVLMDRDRLRAGASDDLVGSATQLGATLAATHASRSALLHSHHVTHWPGGPTQPDNLLLLCRSHHKMVHEGAWTILGDPEGTVEFVKPNGEVLTSHVPKLSEETRRRLLGPLLPDG